jgi:CHAD domain-containing protein
MAYHLKSNESVPDAVRRIVSEEMDAAAGQLRGASGADRDEAIHEARKSVKKVRAVLRLVQPELGATWRVENRRLSEIGRKLSEFRDAAASIESLDSLKEGYREELGPHTLDSIRRGLVARKGQAERNADIGQVLNKLAAGLRSTGKRARTWPLENDGFPAIGCGLERTFSRGRKALALVRANPSPEGFHEWRKRVKDHWYHVRLLEYVWVDIMQAYGRALKDLETWLGDDHNLVVLRDRVLAEPAFYGKATDIDVFLGVVDKRQKELRDGALSFGKRIYAEKPAQFARRMERFWRAWQSQPKQLEELRRAHAGDGDRTPPGEGEPRVPVSGGRTAPR